MLGLHRFVEAVGKWVEQAWVVVSSEPSSSNSASSYAEAQKCIDAGLRLLEDVLRYNMPRFDEPQVVHVMGIFCWAVGNTMDVGREARRQLGLETTGILVRRTLGSGQRDRSEEEEARLELQTFDRGNHEDSKIDSKIDRFTNDISYPLAPRSQARVQ